MMIYQYHNNKCMGLFSRENAFSRLVKTFKVDKKYNSFYKLSHKNIYY